VSDTILLVASDPQWPALYERTVVGSITAHQTIQTHGVIPAKAGIHAGRRPPLSMLAVGHGHGFRPSPE